jgi:hypothetical protein
VAYGRRGIIDKVFVNLNRRLKEMNHANVIVVVRGVQVGLLFIMVVAMLGCASADPESGSSELRQATPTTINSQEMVDCLLPGQIRQLDETVTYLTKPRPIRTTKADCTGRGGAVQPSEEPTGAPSR